MLSGVLCAQRTQLIQPGNGSLQPGLGIIPTLFGLQHAPGAHLALFPFPFRILLCMTCAGHCLASMLTTCCIF